MAAIRRLLQVVALVGTLLVGVVAVALIVSQTPWFRDWLRRYIVRESKQYLNGELAIGRLGGNLFFGVELADVTVDLSGERVVAVKGLEVDYSVFRLISEGVVLDRIAVVEPTLRLERNGEGWTMGQLVKAQRQEADREGPARPIALQQIEIADGTLVIQDHGHAAESTANGNGYALPERIEDLDVRASFEYEPVRYSIGIDHVSFRAQAPDVRVRQLQGKIAVRDDNLYLENLALDTDASALRVDGVVENYLGAAIVRVTTTADVSMPELGRIVPAAEGYALHPKATVTANGPLDALALDLDVRSEAGAVRGQVTADLKGPGQAIEGQLDVESLNLAPLLKDPAQKSDITGRAQIDLAIAATDAPALERLSGSYRFEGPAISAAGYRASNVRATGTIGEGRVRLDARADAYGGRVAARGFIAPPSGRRPLSFELRGHADDVNLRSLPAATRAPALETDLSVAEFHVRGTGRTITGSARLNRSTVEGATIADGTVAEFGTQNGTVTYAARGSVENLDVQRLGSALEIQALARPQYEGSITATFDVRGRGTALETMRLEASGTLADAMLMGARLADLSYTVRLDGGALDASAKGAFEDLNPGRLAEQPRLDGTVSGTVDARVRIDDLGGPITADSIAADGAVTLKASHVGGVQINQAEIRGTYADRAGQIAKLSIQGPELSVEASGPLALDRGGQSNLTYRIEATDLAALGTVAGQEGLDGSVILDGRLTGNAVELQTTGALDGSNLTYQENNALDLGAKYTVTVPELRVADATVKATTTANFVKAGGLELNVVEATTTYARKTLDFDATLKEQRRELQANGNVIFHPDHQEIHLPGLTIRTEGQEWRLAPGTEAAVQYGGSRVSLQNVKLVSSDQALTVEGSFPVGESASGPGDLRVNATNIDLAALETLLMQDRGLGGRLTASATVTGTTQQPLVDGRVEIVDGSFQAYKYERLEAEVDYQARRMDVDLTLQQSATERITARGTVPISLFSPSRAGHVSASTDDRLDVQITSTDLGLGVIQGFTTAVTNVAGTVQADVRLTGSGADPHVEGSVTIRNGAFGVPAAGTSYTGLDTRIELTTDLVRIEKFQIRDEHGEPLTVAGQLAVHAREVGAVDITLTSDNFEVLDNELGDVGVDSELKITGELRRPRVEGQVRIEAGRIEVDQVLALFADPYDVGGPPPVVSAERTVEGSGSAEQATRQALAKAQAGASAPGEPDPEDAPAPAGAFSPVQLDVRLVIPDNLVLRGSDLRPGGPSGAAIGDINITVGGNLLVRKDPGGQARLSGVVNTVRGTYEFQGRRFDLARDGTVRFTGDPQINPLLDVTATRLIPNTGVEARIRITGTADAPELELTSTPPLEESDILALIVFNRPVNELGSGERASLAATAGGIATGFIAAPLGESIGRALDVDLFEITTTTESGELGAGITIGQQVGDRAFFKLRQQFGERNVSEFLIEYQISDFLRAQASAAPETTGSANRLGQRRIERAGIDLIFFFSY